MSWPVPDITIGGVRLPAGAFVWALTAGVLPYQTQVTTIGSLTDQMAAIQNPCMLMWEVYGGVGGEPDQYILRFSNCYLVEPKKIDPVHTLWTLADARWGWRGKTMYYSYNKTRVKNEKGLGVTTPDTDPVSLRQQFDVFKTGRYLPWSVKTDGSPYNMKEILELELGKMGIPFDATVSDDHGAYVIENVEASGVDVYRGLADLLSKSRLNLGILPSGVVYVYSLDYYDITQLDLVYEYQHYKKTRPGVLYKQDLSRIRPSKVNVRFEKKMEVRVLATDSNEILPDTAMPLYANAPVWTQEDIAEWRVIGCENVMPIPYPVTIGGRDYNIGEWIPIWKYLAGVSPAIAESNVRKYYFFNCDQLVWHWARAIEGGGSPSQANEDYAAHIISTIAAHYRKTYQIDPYFVDRMESWEARRSAVIDNYSHFSPPSPLWINYCTIPMRRHPLLAKRTALWDEQAHNWIVATQDPYRAKPSPGTINAINPQLGIFQVSMPPLIDRIFRQIIPSALANLPFPSLTKAYSTLEGCPLLSTHLLETIITVIWSTDRQSQFGGTTKYFHVLLDYASLGGIGPELDYLSQVDYARFPVREYDQDGALKPNSDPAIAINGKLLETVAQVEGAKLINALKDRYSGLVTLAGPVSIRLVGNMKSVLYSFSNRGMETTVDMREIPPVPTLEQKLPQNMIDYLRKHVNRADTKNQIEAKA